MNYAGVTENYEEKRLSKIEYAQCLTAILVYIALQQRDLAGLCALNGTETVFLRASTGEYHWEECVHFLENPPFTVPTKNSGKNQFQVQTFMQSLNLFAAHCSRRGTIFLLSDFFEVESWSIIEPQLKLLTAKGNELILLHVLDEDELCFPFQGRSEFQPLEQTGHSLILNPEIIRNEYLEQFQKWQISLQTGCRGLGITYMEVNTSQPFNTYIGKLNSRATRY